MNGNKFRRLRAGLLVAVVALGIFSLVPVPQLDAQTPTWNQPFRLSLDGGSWFPDLTADVAGRVHVIWSSITLDYRIWDGRGWSATSDISIAADANGAPIDDVFRAGVAAGSDGYLNLFYYHLTEGIGIFKRAPVERAGSARAWFGTQTIGATTQGYYSLIAVDKRNEIHTVYINTTPDSSLADIFYRRSENGGLDWTPPFNLSNSPRVGSSRPQVTADQFNIIHVSWDEGWDRRSGEGTAQTSRYAYSTSGGHDWSSPVTFGNSKMPAVQLVVSTAQTAESRIAVWRTTTDEAVYFQSSADGGKTWTSPLPIPGIYPRPWNSPLFDQYTMVRDDRGTVHLLLVTRRNPNAGDQWALSHIEWNGREWGKPEIIFEREGLFPEYPRGTIALGNQLHVVWFTRTSLWTISAMDVWHNMRLINAPGLTPVPAFPTATPIVLTPTLTPVPTPTRLLPVVSPYADPLPSTGITSMIPLMIGVASAFVGIMIAVGLRRNQRRR
jgi:hypothetical protein